MLIDYSIDLFLQQNKIHIKQSFKVQKSQFIFYIKLRMDIKVVESENEIYHKQKLLGEGAFGKAYLVKRKADDEMLVIKEMNIDHMTQQERNETIKEAQILRNLNHPNIVKFVEVYVTKQNKLKIVMEYAECGDLSKAIAQRKRAKRYFEESQILDWFTQICLAMKHVHDRKILHRDIKGQNIFISKTNTLKLGDFGIARVLNKTMEKARTVVGTPYYLSPQIIENKPYSFQSDIWSIGVVLYELCALTHPFTATSLQFLALKIVKGSFTPIPNQYSKELRGLVNSMLSLDPNKRPSINDIFKSPIIQDRIKNFLTQTKREHEFSHTVLHNHKVQIFTNKLVQMKKQKDIQKQREKLKQEEQLLKQRLEQKKVQQRLKVQQQQKDKQKMMQRQRERQRQAQKQKVKQQQARRQFLEKQRQKKEYERKQAVFEQQRRKQQQQRRIQKQYEQNCKMAKYIQQKIKDEQNANGMRRQNADLMYRQNDRQQDYMRAQKMRKNQQKQLEQERKKKELQQFARKQYFENQQIMRRARQRAKQQQQAYNSYQPEVQQKDNIVEDKLPNFGGKNSPQNFHYQNKKSPQQYQSANQSKNYSKPQSKPEIGKDSSVKSPTTAKSYQSNQDVEKKHLSVREQIKKDRQKFLKGKSQQTHEQQAQIIDSPQQPAVQQSPQVKPGKWQRPKSRQGQTSRSDPVQIQQPPQQPQTLSQNNTINDQTYNFMTKKVSPQDKQNFDLYVNELENLMQVLNQNIQNMDSNNRKKMSPSNKMSPSKKKTSQVISPEKSELAKLPQVPTQQNSLGEVPQVQEVIFRDDDMETFQLSLTADFISHKPKQTDQPQIQASTDLDLFSNFSKLQTLRMNLQDKFGTDNFVQLYRFLQNEMNQKGIQAFTNQESIVNEVCRKFSIKKSLLMDSFTLLLTLIHMEEKMMGCC